MHIFQKELKTFKATFQKGSQIYKFLRETWKTHPLYLDRTLSYISKHRNQPIKRRKNDLQSICQRLLENQLSSRRENTKSNRKSHNHQQNGVSGNNGDSGSSSSDDTPNRDLPPTDLTCYFNWICNDPAKTTQKTKSAGFICPWCEKDYRFLDSLMCHLRYSHPRFSFNLDEGGQSPLINMSLNLSFDGSYCGFKYPGHDLRHDFKFVHKKPKRRTPSGQVIFFRAKRRSHHRLHDGRSIDMSGMAHGNDDGEADVDVCSGRLYYHTSTCLPIKPNEVDVDSEADIDPEWLRERTQLMIDEFTDVNEGEKEVLKLWNLHIMKNYKYKGDAMMRQACFDFVELEGSTLLAKNLTKNFTLHLANLYDFGLISSRDLLECMRKVWKLRQPTSNSLAKSPGKAKLDRNNEKCQHTPPAKRPCLLNSNCNQ